MRDFTQHHNADYYTNSDSYVLDVDLAVRTDVNAFDLVPDLLGNVPGVRGIFDCDLRSPSVLVRFSREAAISA